MQNKNKLIFIFFLFALLIIASCSKQTDYTPAVTKKDTSNYEIVIRAADLHRNYYNEVAADNLYKDKIIKVAGTVTRIKKDSTGNPVLYLRTGISYDNVKCILNISEIDIASNMSSSAELVGKCRGKINDVITIDNCFVVNYK